MQGLGFYVSMTMLQVIQVVVKMLTIQSLIEFLIEKSALDNINSMFFQNTLKL